MAHNNEYNQKPTIQPNSYNGSDPTHICQHYGKEKNLSHFVYRKTGNGGKQCLFQNIFN